MFLEWPVILEIFEGGCRGGILLSFFISMKDPLCICEGLWKYIFFYDLYCYSWI